MPALTCVCTCMGFLPFSCMWCCPWQRRVHPWAALCIKIRWLALMLVQTFSQCQIGGGGGGGGRVPSIGPTPALMLVLIFMACSPFFVYGAARGSIGGRLAAL